MLPGSITGQCTIAYCTVRCPGMEVLYRKNNNTVDDDKDGGGGGDNHQRYDNYYDMKNCLI